MRQPVVMVACCDSCGIENAKVQAELNRLAFAPKWTQRDNAAHALAKYDWRCHPEILPALATALMSDCDKHVRREAAQTLAKLSPSPCMPEVHLALDQAARCDPALLNRKAARKALDRIGRACADPCGVCTPGAVIVAPGLPRGAYVSEPAFFDAGPYPILPPSGYSIAPGGTILPGSEVGPVPSIPGFSPTLPNYSEPTLDTPLPPLEAPGGLPLPSVPSPAVPPLPGDFAPFGVPPEARRELDGRITERDSEDHIRDVRIERISTRDEVTRPMPRFERPVPRPEVSRGLVPFGLLRRAR